MRQISLKTPESKNRSSSPSPIILFNMKPSIEYKYSDSIYDTN